MKGGLVTLAAFLVAVAAGTAADRVPAREQVRLGGYLVLAADLHVHPGMGSGGSLTPWGVTLEAQRRGIDVVGFGGHNTTWEGRIARAFARLSGGPIVLPGQEVTSAEHDLIALGVTSTVDSRLTLREQIDEIHRQGGVAIAAHPLRRYWQHYLAPGVRERIDGTEVCHPVVEERPDARSDLRAMAQRTGAAPIGSSDFHFSGRIGLCRTFVFVTEPGEQAVLDAIRQKRTVVYDPDGTAFGPAELVRLANGAGLREQATAPWSDRGAWLDWISRGAALVMLAAIASRAVARATRHATARP